MSPQLLRIITGLVLAVGAVFLTWWGGTLFAVFVAAAATAMFYEWSRLVRGRGLAWQLAGFAYCLLPALALLWTRERAPHGFEQVLWMFVITWGTDIFAYYSGRAIGGPKLAPAISPNKTIAGFVGGVVGASLAGAAWVMLADLPRLYILLGPVFAAASQGGDLFESWLKRRAGVKDSGNWLPGHGGILDRVDGFVPVAVLTGLAVLATVA